MPAAAAALVAALVIALFAGCGGDKPAYCQDKSALKTSIDKLKKVDISPSTVGDVKSNLDAVGNAARTFAASAKKEFGSQAEALKTAVASLETAVSTAASSPSGQSFATVAAGVSSVQSAYNELSDAVSSKC